MAKHHVSTAAKASGIVFAPIPSKNGKITAKAVHIAKHLTAASPEALDGVAFTGVGAMAKQARHVRAGMAFTLTDAINASRDGEMLSGGRYADLRTLIAADWAIGSSAILACVEGRAKESCAKMISMASDLASAQHTAATDIEDADKRAKAIERAVKRQNRLEELRNMLAIQFELAEQDAQARREREAAELANAERAAELANAERAAELADAERVNSDAEVMA